MLMQMIHIFQHARLSTHNHVVDRAQMLRVLGQPDTTRVRDNGDAEFPRQQENGQDLVDAADATGVRLQHGQGPSLEELFENNAILAHLARGDPDGAVGGV